ncbi:HRDC domain-containing protein [Reinekea marinisedimentorum]|uniref:HRDC domain-containing protein n=1 Tax=Reinekea marinisedimentorum TaxID=230495 RepID=A0A4R3HVR1_9GAMM|nr:HRDC domain-containing protein [Reinekea marinisedimentorum]TCS36165.1 HRDC domain-containing protein [Reinekea marinisedimentorum]
MTQPQTNPELELARDFIEQTGTHLFLTGKAGTGKTTFLHELREHSSKRMIVTAPTGVAALNAGGVTLHSFFQLPFGPILPEQSQQPIYRFSKDKINIIRSLDLLVIDEISMVRADMLDGVDAVLRRFRNGRLPFGGVQLLLIGDLHQLPPVVKPDGWSLLQAHYASPYFFSSLALQRCGYTGIELKKVYRQSEEQFIALLNAVREERWTPDVLSALNERYQPVEQIEQVERYITLTTHNRKADVINRQNLGRLTGESRKYVAVVDGDFSESIYPVDFQLELKPGARVMFTRNDGSEERLYYNGKIGVVESFDAGAVTVYCEEDDQRIRIEPVTWENTQYRINEQTKEVEANVTGSFTQIPLRLAWAITIHKSQGLTFDRAIVDAQEAFTTGQTYVALSRCRSLEGLVLSSRVSAPNYSADDALLQFDADLEAKAPNQAQVQEAKRLYQYQLLADCFDFSEEVSLLKRWLNSQNRIANLIANLPAEQLTAQVAEFEQKVAIVAGKFQPQLQSYCAEGIAAENEALSERLKKAGGYFIAQLQPLFNQVEAFHFEADNKADEKRLRQIVDKLQERVQLKLAVFTQLASGFEPALLLKARAEASLLLAKKAVKKPKAPALTEADVPFPALFEQLRQWRKDTADENGAPVYTVLQQKALVQIVCHLPGSSNELLQLQGIGPATVERYGEGVLAIVSDFCAAEAIDPTEYPKAALPGD